MIEPLKRGNLLWESSRMFLPEHKQALLARKETLKKVPKPLLDDQELQEIGYVVMDSLHYTLSIEVEYWEDGFFKVVNGIVNLVDYQMKFIKLETESFGVMKINIDCLRRVERL
ncbi:YolD-like family protein [Halalkalibacter urbisdiaboli]|uniref:YolD-like family protein n=1 Tax=Halalkalibacter urbisdiaboli TaxID=1960589 RepID=UPI000B44A03B|nr:YolD-like family protein [Halalkalibacter urbisdiaboli]